VGFIEKTLHMNSNIGYDQENKASEIKGGIISKSTLNKGT